MDEIIWLTQKLIAALFEVDVRTINEHSGNVYHDGERHLLSFSIEEWGLL